MAEFIKVNPPQSTNYPFQINLDRVLYTEKIGNRVKLYFDHIVSVGYGGQVGNTWEVELDEELKKKLNIS